MAGGLISFGSAGSGGGLYSFGAPALSPTQLAEVQAAKSKSPKNTILGDIEATGSGIYHGSTSALGAALNYLSRPSAAVDTALTEAATHRGQGLGTFEASFHGLSAGIQGHSHDTFSDFIRAAYPKFAAHHKTATALGGFAGTVLTDPTLPLIIGAQAVPGLNVGVDEAEAARLADLMGTAASAQEKAHQAQATLDAIGKYAGTATEHNMTARKALAQINLRVESDVAAGKMPSLADLTEQVTSQAAAKTEATLHTQKLLQAKYSIPFSHGKSIALTPTHIAGVRVAPRLPSLEGVGKAGIPGLSKAANVAGEMFKHGYGTEDFTKIHHAAAVKAKEYVADNFFRFSHAHMHQHFSSMSEDEMLRAIDYGETRHGIVRASKAGRTLNEPMLAKALRHKELSEPQVNFIRDWHKVMEHLRTNETQFGVNYQGDIGNILYVPHTFLRDGGTASIKDLKTNFGLEKERQNLTLKNLTHAVVSQRAAGKNLDLVTNPAEIMGRRIEAGVQAATQRTMHRVLARTVGVPAKIPDMERRAKALQNVRAGMKKQRGLTHIENTAGTRKAINDRYSRMGRQAAARILDKHQVTLDKIDEQTTHHMEAAATATKRVPVASKISAMSQKSFKQSIAHFSTPDRIAAVKIHGRMSEGRRLENKLARLGKGKGGPQTKAKELAKEVQALTGREVHAPTARGETWRGAIKDELFAERKNMQGEYNDLVKKYQSGKAYDHGKAIKRLAAHRERVMDKAAKEIHRAKFRISARRGVELEDWQKTFDRQASQFKNIQREIDKEQRAYGAVKNNPDVPAGWLKYDAAKLDGGYHYFSPEIHAAMSNIERLQNNKNIQAALGNAWRGLMSKWKIAVTSANLGYRVRNTASDIWNMYIAGVPTLRIAQFGNKAARLQVLAHHAGEKLARGETDLSPHELHALQQFAEMQLNGVLSGLFQGDIQQISEMYRAGNKARDYINGINPVGLGKAYIKGMQDMNRHVENWGRITHYLYRRDYQRLSAQASADWVKKAHFDYEELTPFERDKMKAIFPFYTWTRKDIPYQLAQMASRPGKYAVFAHAIQTSNELATGNPHTPDQQPNTLPDWMRNNYMFRVPGFGKNAYVNPNIGVQDLGVLEHPIQQGFNQHVNPVFQIAAAIATGKNPGTGQDIVGTHPRNPVSGIGADILRAFPGANVGPTERMVGGKEVQGQGANPWYTFAAQQIPGVNFLVNQESPIKAQERGSGAYAPLSYLGGLSIYERDLNAENTAAQLNFQDQMKRVLRGARDTGKLANAQQKKVSPFQAALNQIIQNGG